VAFLQDRARKRHKRQKCDVVCDKHTGKKAQKNKHQHQLRGIFGLCQKPAADRIEQSVALKSCHNQHQRQQNAEHAPVNVAHVLRTRVHPECRCHSEGCGDREYCFFFYKICDLLQHVVHHLFCFIVKIPFLFYFSFLHLHRIFF